jgi:pilus assembly protein CpaC
VFAITVCAAGATAQDVPQPLNTFPVPQLTQRAFGQGNPGRSGLALPAQVRQPNGVPTQQGIPQQRNSARRGLNGLRLPYLPELPRGLGTPKSDPLTRERYNRFVKEELDPEQTLTLVVNRPKVLRFSEAPVRTYIPEAGSEIIALRYVDPAAATHVAIEPLQTGSTVLSMWFKDPAAPGGQQYLSWLVNVVEDPEQGRRLEAVYASLEREINQNFPNSVVQLSLVGDKLLVRGQAKDIQDASQILRIVGSNAPGGPQAVPVRNVDLNLVSGLNPNGDNAFDDGEIQSLLLRTAEQDAVEAGSTVINMLRVAGEQQVNLKVIVAEVNRNALRAIGANMSVGPNNSSSFMSAFGTQSVVQGLNSNILSAEGGTFGINRGDFQLAVNALRRLGYARTLAEPNVVALNGQPAIFRAGDTFPVPAANVSFGAAAQSVSQQFVGVQIRFLPVITDNDRVRLQLSGTVSTLDNALQANIGGANVPGTNTRNFFTTVELREGQTLALAGLISRSSQANSSRVPLLGDVPGIGRLFNTDDVSSQEQELLILVTPQLVRPLDDAEGLPLPGSDIFEPDDLEFYVNGRIESCRPEDYRSPIRTTWDRIRAGRNAQSRLLIGPSGYSNGTIPAANVVSPSHITPPSGVVPAQHVIPAGSGRARLRR